VVIKIKANEYIDDDVIRADTTEPFTCEYIYTRKVIIIKESEKKNTKKFRLWKNKNVKAAKKTIHKLLSVLVQKEERKKKKKSLFMNVSERRMKE
jgi:hypothetical protein